MSVVEKFRPSNGTEGAGFFEGWCSHCARDKPLSEGKNFDECGPDEVCDIIARTFAHNITDQEYPVEWIIDSDGPRCTAFIQSGTQVQARCTRTEDMFSGEARGKE